MMEFHGNDRTGQARMGCSSFSAGSRRESLMACTSRGHDIVVSRAKGEPALFIGRRRVEACPKAVLLLERLWQKAGRVVTYEDLCLILGRARVGREERHLLRQYTQMIKRMLVEHGAPYALAVAANAGYALCMTA
jgi:hypothetical protein